MQLVLASNNAHKVAEIKQMLGKYFSKILSMAEAGIEAEVEETGATFYDNALLKARALQQMLPSACVLADDSGLCCDALNGAPGVFSARYSGEPCCDSRNNEKLLEELKGKKNRNAHFVCTLVLLTPQKEYVAIGESRGEILFAPRGNGGFGYDPLFYSYELCETFGKATQQQKNMVSHRSKALKSMVEQLEADLLLQ